MSESYDVVIVGGGVAGLSAALALGRARRSVVVVDAGEPRNAPAGAVHNYLTRDGTPPAELLTAGRAEVQGYGGALVDGLAARAVRDADGFAVTLDDGRLLRGRRLLAATGLVDELPELPGLAVHWGRGVLHCPYCHGWEVRDQRIGILATSPLAVEQALLWRQWSPHVLLLCHGTPPPAPQDAERLAARGIPVVPEPVAALEADGDALAGVRLSTGELVPLDALVVGARATPRASVLEPLGLLPVEVEISGHVVGSQIPAAPDGATAVPGVWVVGNLAGVRAQVVTSAAAGLTAGAAINADLVAEEVAAALAGYRERRDTMLEEAAWEERYRSRPQIWSGHPNPVLVAEAADLVPGHALDVGSGEGADAIWLARRGWRVTAADLSTTALQRGAEHARDTDADAAGRIEWVHADLREQVPDGRYDLVSSHFMHLPREAMRALVARLAAAVAPGGTLLVVGHHPADLRTSAHRPHFPDMMFTAEEVAAQLDPDGWVVLTAEARPRPATDPEGHEIIIRDAVLVARRR